MGSEAKENGSTGESRCSAQELGQRAGFEHVGADAVQGGVPALDRLAQAQPFEDDELGGPSRGARKQGIFRGEEGEQRIVQAAHHPLELVVESAALARWLSAWSWR